MSDFRGADYLLLGVYNSEAWARQVGERFLQQKRGSGRLPLFTTLEAAPVDIEDAFARLFDEDVLQLTPCAKKVTAPAAVDAGIIGRVVWQLKRDGACSGGTPACRLGIRPTWS